MRILYLDTSSSFLYAAIVNDEKVIIEVKEGLGKDLSSFALVKIEEMFGNSNLSPSDVDKIIVVNGPGSFTGIRIGLTIAKVYAWSLGKKISVISSLEAMAVSIGKFDYVVPLIDARREYVYSAIYDKDFNLTLKEQYINLEALKIATAILPGDVCYVSNDKFHSIDTVNYNPDILKIVTKFKDRENLNPHEVDAYYLKLTEAEENIK